MEWDPWKRGSEKLEGWNIFFPCRPAAGTRRRRQLLSVHATEVGAHSMGSFSRQGLAW